MSDVYENNDFIEDNNIPEGMIQVQGKGKKKIVTKKSKKVESAEHNLRIALNQIVRDAGKAGIPIFVTFYTEEDGYFYNGILPEEIGTENLRSEYKKFDEFLKTCIGFNKENELKPIKVFKE